MLSLTRKTDYALVALVALARRAPAKISAREIGREFRLPLSALTNILNQLTHQGLIISTRGVKGGYRLAREPEKISMTDLLESIGGEFSLTTCSARARGVSRQACGREDLCPASSSLRKIDDIFRQFLSSITLDHIVRGNVPDGLELLGSSK